MAVLQEHYTIASNWKGKKYLGLDLNWDYNNRKVHLLMLGYVAEALTRFHTNTPASHRISPTRTSGQIMEQRPSMLKQQTTLLSSVNNIKNCPGSHSYPLVL